MGNTLLTYNSNFSKEAEKIADDWANGRNQNDATANKFRSYVNSAPANLRYGDPKQNSAIGKFVDPMGDQNQKMTPKEKQWHIMIGKINYFDKCKKVRKKILELLFQIFRLFFYQHRNSKRIVKQKIQCLNRTGHQQQPRNQQTY